MIIIVKPRLKEVFFEKIIRIPNDLKGELITINLKEEKFFSPKASLEVEGIAKGEVEIINNSNQNQTLIRTTRLLSQEGVLFRLDHQVFVPAKSRVKAKVYADKPGKESEIGPTKFIIPGLSATLQKLIYAESYEKMKGGIKKIGIVTEEDIKEAKEDIERLLNDKAEKEIQEKIREKTINLAEWKIYPIERKIEVVSEAKAGEEKGEFLVNGSIDVILFLFKERELMNLIEKLAKNSLPSDEELKNIDEKSLTYNLKNLNLEEKTGEFEIKIKIYTIIKENSSIFNLEKIKTLNEKELKNFLEQYKEIEEVKIKFHPFWKRKIPKKDEFIKIKIYGK